ncbi:serine/threonine protein kinase [Oceanobacillus chungangensis]|uniref:non-specific serine/threonine protein kinase n=1 Tax=Oceanobacillus chungangensis TaxID=1229152 RepID=A0A3D8PZV9_9BACI|nr:serine/threonine-protein kinase [Oceanobacillus chungangensis]RDW21726.1 hypothetical protein CWR45_02305 [Oceanobacillus chungangensis]
MNKHGILIERGDLLNNKYIVLSHIASGGMSEVYLIEEKNNLGKRWAVKITSITNKLAAKLKDEARLLSELHHSSLPHVVDFFQTEEYFYLVQEYVEGVSLSDQMALYNNQLPMETILHIGIELCEVLHYLHNQKPYPIIYRDIKPGNIMVMNNRSIKLIDFGIARRFQENLIQDTVQVGTVGFAAPEQFEKRQTDRRTDLFSLGALLYYLVSKGKYVYIAQKPIRDFNKKIPKDLEKCINKLVQLQPKDRIQDAREAKKLLLKAQEELEKPRNILQRLLLRF